MDNQQNNNQLPQEGQNTAIKRLDIDRIFLNDPYGLFVYKKAEKLVAGVYLLTNYLSDKEPIKWSLREFAGSLLFQSLSMSDRVWGEEGLTNDVLSSICEMLSILNIAKISQIISETNYEIIVEEFNKLADFLATSSKNMSSAKIAFKSNFFDGDYDFVSNHVNQNQPSFSQGGLYKGQKDIKDNQNNHVLNNKMSETKKSSLAEKVKDKNNRQEIIVSMLKSGLKLTIKDFAQNIKDCSEKTIQRELLSLVSKGVLKKEGERRWSKYSLS